MESCVLFSTSIAGDFKFATSYVGGLRLSSHMVEDFKFATSYVGGLRLSSHMVEDFELSTSLVCTYGRYIMVEPNYIFLNEYNQYSENVEVISDTSWNVS